MNNNLLTGSDKQYWHRYLPIYEKELNKLKVVRRVLEFGIFKGESIKWIYNKYPEAKIFASDILPIQPEWPIAQNIKYLYVDQGDTETIRNVFKEIGDNLDLIIEDGSHFPEHQKNCLIQGINHISSGGLYILEDLHTSHPEHPFYKNTGLRYIPRNYKMILRICDLLPLGSWIRNYLKSKFSQNGEFIGPLHLLLCLEHLKITGKDIDESILKQFSYNSLFSPDEVIDIFKRISEIKIYKRSTLPHKCFVCGSTDFQYHSLKCKCGADIYSNSDSIAAIIHIK
jgi:hypothetical protein